MRINALEITDFRVFRGSHRIDLAPRKKYGRRRSIVLFGGLNGAGKTSILTAVRLALYGKHALGKAVSQAEYEEFLRESVYRSPASIVNPETARVALDFTHSNLGEITNYVVTREWRLKRKSVAESLTITKNGHPLPELSYEQCQSFLNELVPIGVSDLFFFDGEKIADLAEEGGTAALAAAIKKLLGLDLVDRLNADLSTYMRQQAAEQLPERSQHELKALKAQYEAIETEITCLSNDKSYLTDSILQLEKELAELERQFAAKGGAWAGQRAELQAQRQLLDKQRHALEEELRCLIGGLFPFSLAPELLHATREQLNAETTVKQSRAFADAVDRRLPELVDAVATEMDESNNEAFRGALQTSLKSAFSRVVADHGPVPLVHDVSDSERDRILLRIQEALESTPAKVAETRAKLDHVCEELSTAELQLQRAPHDDRLLDEISQIKSLQARISVAIEKRGAIAAIIRNQARQGIELVRAMRKLKAELTSSGQQRDTYGLASRTKSLLVDFSSELRIRKIQSLQSNFRDAFVRLARKEDVIQRVEINPDTFDVTLFGKSDQPIGRNRLSAGEKQIYAIAILESLMKTSGRALPVIVDTPLGRLDSKHRDKLINNYFPVASHQTIILSTDTEVDERFYETLSPDISHAYHVMYDQSEHASRFAEGYFWRERKAG